MNQFLYSGNFKLNLTLPRHVKSFLSLKPCLALGRTLTAHAYTHSYNPGVLMFSIDGTTGLDASIVDKINVWGLCPP